jgi:hypothetical protein
MSLSLFSEEQCKPVYLPTTLKYFLFTWMLLQFSTSLRAAEQQNEAAAGAASSLPALPQDPTQHLSPELLALYVKGEQALAQLSAEQQEQMLSAIAKVVDEVLGNSSASAKPQVVQMPVEGEEPQPAPAPFLATWKQKLLALTTSSVASLSAFCGITSADHWKKAIALAITASCIYCSTSVVGVLIPIPKHWQGLWRTFARAVIGASLTVPANMIYYTVVELGLVKGSTVNIIAIGALMNIVGGSLGTFNSLVFFHQAQVWTVWVGLAAATAVAVLQMWHALTYPVAMK